MAFRRQTPGTRNSGGGGITICIERPCNADAVVYAGLIGVHHADGTKAGDSAFSQFPAVLRGTRIPKAQNRNALDISSLSQWLNGMTFGHTCARSGLKIAGIGRIQEVSNKVVKHLIREKLLPSLAKQQPAAGKKVATSRGYNVQSLTFDKDIRVKSLAAKLLVPHLTALIAGTCTTDRPLSLPRNTFVNRGMCLLSDPFALATSSMDLKLKLALTHAAHGKNVDHFTKLSLFITCLKKLDRAAANALILDGVAICSQNLNRLADEAHEVILNQGRHDFMVTRDNDLLITCAAKDAMAMMSSTTIIWNGCSGPSVFDGEHYDTCTPVDFVYDHAKVDVPLRVESASAMTWQQLRLILAFRSKVEFHGSFVPGIYEQGCASPSLASFCVMSSCWAKNRVVEDGRFFISGPGQLLLPMGLTKQKPAVREAIRVMLEEGWAPIKVKAANLDTGPLFRVSSRIADHLSSEDSS